MSAACEKEVSTVVETEKLNGEANALYKSGKFLEDTL